MVIRAENISYQIRDGYHPSAADYREVHNLARVERVLDLTRETIKTAAKQGDALAVRRLTFQADRQQHRASALRGKLREVLA